MLMTTSLCLHDHYSIDHLSEVARNAIEAASRLKEEMVISQEDFLVSEVSSNNTRAPVHV